MPNHRTVIRELLLKQRKRHNKKPRQAASAFRPPQRSISPMYFPHFHGGNWVNFILSDIIGYILVRLEGFELSTPGSGDLQMRMINYMKFSEPDTIAFPAVPIPFHSHLGNFRAANCARLCAQLFLLPPIQALHACLRYQPGAARLAELFTLYQTRWSSLRSSAELLHGRLGDPPALSCLCGSHDVCEIVLHACLLTSIMPVLN